ncbi:hypothetical protein Tco_0911182 [Tanacetum coccineum]|uniref:Reverse transcriptase domain-containing protein n=1 Tax=Tanacetum coccineum TaxID=301880 RepID=A0ABQ5CWQ3_9ASTR
MKGKEIPQENLDGSASDADLREYCDKHYNQLLPILAEKTHQEKVQQEKLKAVKARLNFEEVLQHSESGTLSRRKDLKKRLGYKHIRSIAGSPEPRRDRSESPRKKGPERKTMFKRLEKGVFHRLRDKEKGMFAYSNDSRLRSYYSSHMDTESCYQSSRSRGAESAPKKGFVHTTIVTWILRVVTRVPAREEQNLLLRKVIARENSHAGRKHCPKGRTVPEGIGSQDRKGRSQVSKKKICPNHGYVRKHILSHLGSGTLIFQRHECPVTSRHMTEAKTQKIT